jgi:hypothetical protein
MTTTWMIVDYRYQRTALSPQPTGRVASYVLPAEYSLVPRIETFWQVPDTHAVVLTCPRLDLIFLSPAATFVATIKVSQASTNAAG